VGSLLALRHAAVELWACRRRITRSAASSRTCRGAPRSCAASWPASAPASLRHASDPVKTLLHESSLVGSSFPAGTCLAKTAQCPAAASTAMLCAPCAQLHRPARSSLVWRSTLRSRIATRAMPRNTKLAPQHLLPWSADHKGPPAAARPVDRHLPTTHPCISLRRHKRTTPCQILLTRIARTQCAAWQCLLTVFQWRFRACRWGRR